MLWYHDCTWRGPPILDRGFDFAVFQRWHDGRRDCMNVTHVLQGHLLLAALQPGLKFIAISETVLRFSENWMIPNCGPSRGLWQGPSIRSPKEGNLSVMKKSWSWAMKPLCNDMHSLSMSISTSASLGNVRKKFLVAIIWKHACVLSAMKLKSM